jgi:palmitoyltransferase
MRKQDIPYMLTMIIVMKLFYFYFGRQQYKKIQNKATRTLVSTILHTTILLFLWSYITAIFKDPGRPPSVFVSLLLTKGLSLDESLTIRKRYCTVCRHFKPPRAHHCSKLGRCVLCMDHYCKWIGSTIGFFNRKAFLLMLFYADILLVFYLCACAKRVNEIKDEFLEKDFRYFLPLILKVLFLPLCFACGCAVLCFGHVP